MKRTVIAFLILIFPISIFGTVTIRLKKAVSIEKTDIRLGDIAEITADDGRLFYWNSIRISDFNRRKKVLKISYNYIKAILLSRTQKMFFLIGTDIEIKRPVFTITADVIKSYIKKLITNRYENHIVRVEFHSGIKKCVIPGKSGKINLLSVFPAAPSSLNSVSLGIKQNGRIVKVFRINCKVHLMKKNIVLLRDIKSGIVLQRDIIGFKLVNAASSKVYAYSKLSKLIGRRFIRDIKKGSFLKDGDLEEPILVRRGDYIKISFESGAVSISARAKALNSGKLNKIIMAENLHSHKRIYVVVSGYKKAKISSAGESK